MKPAWLASLAAIGWVVTTAHAANIAIVTDLQGGAAIAETKGSRKLTILSGIAAGDRVELPANATLVALYLDGGIEYVLHGAATVEFKAAQPEVISGPAMQRRSVPLGNGDIRLKAGGLAQGAMVMRGADAAMRIRVANLDRTRTLDPQPEFRWSGIAPGQTYAFELDDETGRTILETKVEGTRFKLPADVVLRESVPYTWKVSAVLPDGRKYSTSAVFAVAPAAVRAEAEALRPPPSAPVSSTVAYAVWLQQAELRDEARDYWRAASAQRPGDQRLRALAVQ